MIANQIVICCILLVTGTQLLFAYPENHMKIWLVIMFLSIKIFSLTPPIPISWKSNCWVAAAGHNFLELSKQKIVLIEFLLGKQQAG